MTKQEFLQKLEEENTFIGAEKLASKFSHTIIKSDWRISYDFIRYNHLNSIGWKTLGINRTQQNEEFIISLGFMKCFDFYINVDKKIMIKLSEYGRDLPYIHIKNGLSNTPPPIYILSLSQYKDILISEVDILLQKRESIKSLIRDVIDDYKSEIEAMDNHNIEQEIIQKALEEARRNGILPKDKESFINF